MYGLTMPIADEGLQNIKVIQFCSHCGDETAKNAKFCPLCSRKSSREQQHEENKKIMGSDWICSGQHK